MLNNVAIIGAGLGGLATAIALHYRGIQAHVYEKARALRPIGAGLTLAPNGLSSLEASAPGIIAMLKQAGSETTTINLSTSDGQLVASNPLTLQERYGQPAINIRWSRLQETLAAFLPPHFLHLQHHCTHFEQDDTGVEICFEHGKTVHADLLIGADGINSTIRHILFNDGPPTYAGRISWRGVIAYSHPLLPANHTTVMTSIEEGKVLMLADAGAGYIFWSATVLSADNTRSENAATAKQRLLTTYAGWAEPVLHILEATPAEDIAERPICDRLPLGPWSKGRVTLLGDAAHPMAPALGQGANTAFEDAWELACFLARESSLDTALACYDYSRNPRVHIIQIRSAYQSNRAYDPDGQTFIQKELATAHANQEDFENWLYTYDPTTR